MVAEPIFHACFYLGPVAYRGVGGRGAHSHPSILVAEFFQGVPFVIISRDPFLADQHQKFSKGTFGANITTFEGERAPKKTLIFGQIFFKRAQNVIFY